MPKIKVSDYSAVLKSLVKDSPPEDLEKNFDGFLQLLQKNHQLELLDEILDHYERRLAKEKGKIRAIVHVGEQPPSAEELHELEEYLCAEMEVKEVEFQLVSDLTSTGLLTDVGDWRFDWTMRRQLDNFRQQLRES